MLQPSRTRPSCERPAPSGGALQKVRRASFTHASPRGDRDDDLGTAVATGAPGCETCGVAWPSVFVTDHLDARAALDCPCCGMRSSDTRSMTRRWDGDDHGRGIADAAAFAPGAEALVAAMLTAAWVAEDPDAHLLPHIRRACESLPLRLVEAVASDDGSFDLELRWTGGTHRLGEVRAAIFALVGSFAEASTHVRQLDGDGDTVSFDVVTGMLDGESPFAPHGHTLRLTVAGIR